MFTRFTRLWGRNGSPQRLGPPDGARDRLLVWSHLLTVVFWTLTALSVVWAFPYGPWGLSLKDYDEKTASTVLLLLGSTAAGGASIFLRSRAGDSTDSLVRLAFYDSLTGLANRALFVDRLDQAMVRAREERKHLMLLFLDLDQFKSVNDRFGHLAGDQLLVGLADRLQRLVGPLDTVGRLGGDEFTVLLDSSRARDPVRLAASILEDLEQPFRCEGHEIRISVSIGVSIHQPDATSTVHDLIRSADAAMYQAKSKGKGRYAVHLHTRAAA